MKELELGKLLPKRNWAIEVGSFVGLSLILCCSLAAQTQGPQYPNAPSASQPHGMSGGSFSSQGAFSGSVPQG
ncbi:MAG TPA: hypothetical protein VLK33_01085, partial [Terriglobales bacterium]|nr:hypothetical protein [Terriglobales bacterium]